MKKVVVLRIIKLIEILKKNKNDNKIDKNIEKNKNDNKTEKNKNDNKKLMIIMLKNVNLKIVIE